MMDTLLLIDGNAMMHRAFYAIPTTFKTSEGVPTNAVYGFLTMLTKAIADFKPEYVIVCFDTPVPTFRKKLLKTYQSHRPKIADEFVVQIPLIQTMLDKAGITRVEKEGYEADDVIGTIVNRYKKDHRILIFTGDKDIMQLVNKNVYVMSPQTGLSSIKLYNEVEVKAKLGVIPEKIPDLKGLMGDPSDNYPGAKGIGPKTASDLILRFETIENLLANIDSIENKRVQEIVRREEENIRLSKQLATILQDVPVETSLEASRFRKFGEPLRDYLGTLQMNSLITRIYSYKNEDKPKPKKEEKKVDDTVQQSDLFS